MENEYSDLKIHHIKLASGDEILGLVSSVEKGMMYVEYPVLVDILEDAYMMADYMPTAKNNLVTFYTSHVVAMSDVLDSIKEQYIKYCIGVIQESTIEDEDVDDMYDIQMPADKSKYH